MNSSAPYLRKALSPRGDALLITVEARELIQAQMDRIKASPSAMIHLGQALMSAALLQALTDPSENDRVQCEWLAKGDFGHVYAEAHGPGRLRGTLGVPQAGAELLGKDLGPGLLQVRRHHAGSLSTGMIDSVGRVSDDLVEYLRRSEQRMCGTNLSVKIEWDEHKAQQGFALPFRVKSAHAFLVHVLPAASEAQQEAAMQSWDAQIRVLGAISQWKLSDTPSVATSEMLDMLAMKQDVESIFETPLELYCTCSEERAARALALVEAQGGEDPSAEAPTVRCEFCGASYLIGKA